MTTDIQTEYRLGAVSQIPPGEGREFRVEGQLIAVFHTRSGALYATQARCPHRDGPLADGLVGGTTVICPLHAWKFDLINGEALMGNCSIATFPVRVADSGEMILSYSRDRLPTGGDECASGAGGAIFSK